MPRRFDLICFDWDGTLFDSTALIVRAIQQAVADVGGQQPSRETAAYVIGMALAPALAHAAPDVPPEKHPLLAERSPITRIDAIHAPLLLLQGSEDAIVPADQATAMHRAVADRGLPVALKVFPGEGHGFRIDSNIRRALEAELSFYAQVWGLDSPEEYRDAIRVENLD